MILEANSTPIVGSWLSLNTDSAYRKIKQDLPTSIDKLRCTAIADHDKLEDKVIVIMHYSVYLFIIKNNKQNVYRCSDA